jgi:hypothetical protein
LIQLSGHMIQLIGHMIQLSGHMIHPNEHIKQLIRYMIQASVLIFKLELPILTYSSFIQQ